MTLHGNLGKACTLLIALLLTAGCGGKPAPQPPANPPASVPKVTKDERSTPPTNTPDENPFKEIDSNSSGKSDQRK